MLLFSLIIAIVLAAAEIDLIIPSFPELQSVFGVSAFKVELVLTLNLIAHCITAIFAGSLGDKYGKKHLIVYGLFMFIVGSIMAALTSNFYIILLGRVLQGIGIAPAMTLVYVIGGEKFPNSAAKIMGILNGMYGFSLAIAPSIGSYVSFFFGWRGNFWALAIFGLITLILTSIFIPNDRKNNKEVKVNILQYFLIFKNKTTTFYLLSLCFCAAGFYTFVAMAPLFYMGALGVSIEKFGIYQGIPALAYATISTLSGIIIAATSKKFFSFLSASLILVFIVLSLIMISGHLLNPITSTIAMAAFSISIIMPWNAMFALMLASMPESSSKVSALFSTLRWVFAAIGIQTAGHFYNNSYVAIGIVTIIAVLISTSFMILAGKRDSKLKESLV